jgi:CubicO group peptidase (beta-lactamase class C family)
MNRFPCFLFLATLLACSNNPGKNKDEKIDYLLQQAFDDNEFIGNVLVADQGRVVYKRSFGQKDHQSNVPCTDSTKFLVGSISKPITAILILRLVDRGLVKLHDSLNKYFAKVDSQIAKITIHHLLTHTSGIDEIITEEKNMDLETLLGEAKLRFQPGSDFEYSNSGYVLLKEIAEKATQQDFRDLVHEEIFVPANMTSSGVARHSMVQALATGYEDPTQEKAVTIEFPFENIDGAGSIYSTVEDLYKLDRALYTETTSI